MNKSALWAKSGLFYCVIVWGSTFIFTKNALGSVNAEMLVGLRFFLASLLLLPLMTKRRFGIVELKRGVILGFLLAALFLPQTIGLKYTSASNSGFISGLFILFLPVFSFCAGKGKPTVNQFAAALLAVAGLWFLTGGVAGFNSGDALTIVAAAAYAGHLLFTDNYVKKDADIIVLAFFQFLVVGLLAFFTAWLRGRLLWIVGPVAWATIAYLALAASVATFLVQMYVQKTEDPFSVGMIFTLEPAFAAFFAWQFGGEIFTYAKIVGGSLIMTGMLVSEIYGRKNDEIHSDTSCGGTNPA